MTTIDVQVTKCRTVEAQRIITGRRMPDSERSFREKAGLCGRCGLHSRTAGKLCEYCDADDETRQLNEILNRQDRRWAKKRVA